jgi:hypothetical protein
MINHVSIGLGDIPRAKSFYDAVLKPLGYACLSSSKRKAAVRALTRLIRLACGRSRIGH